MMKDYPEGFCLTEDEGFNIDMGDLLERDNVKLEKTGKGIITILE